MPTKTKSKKNSVVTSKKKRGILYKINFNSKKTQFITVILLVAVLGGGWFTYRSFAAETASTANVGNSKLRCVSGSTACSTPTEAKKNNIPVVQLGYLGNSFSIHDFMGYNPAPSAVDVCIYATSGGGVINARVEDRGAGGRVVLEKQYSIVGEYKWYCMPTARTSGSAFGVRVNISAPAKTGNTVRISAIQAKPGAFIPLPAPAPAK